MTPEQICEVLVRDGVLESDADEIFPASYYMLAGSRFEWASAEKTISDWRVAGACLERMTDDQIIDLIIPYVTYADVPELADGDALRKPAKICEAYAKAVSDE